MATSFGNVFAQGLLGAVMGGANAAYRDSIEEEKRKAELEKQERLAQIAEKREAAREQRAEATKRKDIEENADFYKRTGPQTKTSTYTDTLGDEVTGANAGAVTNQQTESRQEVAARRLEEARMTGKPALINQSYGEAKDIRAETEQERKTKADEARILAADRLAATREGQLEIQRRAQADRERKTDAMIAGLISRREKSDLPERKYNDKQWSDAKKELVSTFTIEDRISGKSRPDATARYWATATMRRLQSSGDVDPVDAATAVGDIVTRVTESARVAAKGDENAYQRLVAAGMKAQTARLFKQGDEAPQPRGIVDPFAQRPSTPASQSPAPQPSPKRAPESAVDPMAAQFEQETRLIEQGKLRDYSSEVKAWLLARDAAQTAERSASEDAYLKREQARMLRRPGF